MTGISSWLAIQGSFCQASLVKNTVCPSLTSHKLWCWMRLLFSWVDLQMLELGIFSLNLISNFLFHSRVYFVWHSLSHGSSSWVIHFHQILAPITLFISNGSLSPNTPTYLGLQMVFQSTKGHFLCPFLPPHRKFIWIFLVYFITNFGASRTEKR